MFYPSAYFNRHKETYVERIRAVSERGEWREWILFFLEALETQARDSYERTFNLIELHHTYNTQYSDAKTSHRLA